MKTFSVCILDSDQVRADIIKDALNDYGYVPKILDTETSALKALIEDQYDIAFVSFDFSDNISDFLMKLKKFSQRTAIIGMLQDSRADAQLIMSEMDVRHYVYISENAKEFILEKLSVVEAEVMKGDQRRSFLYAALNEAKKTTDKTLSKHINTAMKIIFPAEKEEGRLKGVIGSVPYYEVLRLCANIYDEGTLEFVNEKDRAVFIIKNRTLVSVFVTPGVRGLKAFLRVANWEKGHFHFKNTISVSYPIESEIAYMGMQKLCSLGERSCEWYARMRKNVPGEGLKIKFNVGSIDLKTQYTSSEFDILCTIIDHEMVGDILNYNNSDDIDIYDALINLRKKGAIEVQGI